MLAVLLQSVFGSMLLLSPAFKNFEDIPNEFACDPYYKDKLVGQSPPLEWYRPPEKTQSFILMVDDMNSENGAVQWLVTNIPKTVSSLAQDASRYSMPPGSIEYPNTIDQSPGFASLCPIGKTHTYRFRLYALRVPSVNLTMNNEMTVTDIETQISNLNDDVLYVSVLVGKMFIPPVPSASMPPSPSAPPRPPVEVVPFPISQRRYVKPSETFKNKRPHYNPRPMNGTDLEVVCKRLDSSSKQYAQVCGDSVTPGEAVKRLRGLSRPQVRQSTQLIEKGGAEEGGNSIASKAKKGETKARALSMKKESVAKRPPSPKRSAADATAGTGSLAEASGESAGLVDWDCSPRNSETGLMLRSPMIDACESTGYPVLPAEFACDPLAKDVERVTPPLVWKLKQGSNDTSCHVMSYVLLLEDLHSAKLHWVMTDISPSVNFFDMGANENEGAVTLGVEKINSFKTTSYKPPCALGVSPHAFRFHLVGLARAVKLTDTFDRTGVLRQLEKFECHSSALDFVVVQQH